MERTGHGNVSDFSDSRSGVPFLLSPSSGVCRGRVSEVNKPLSPGVKGRENRLPLRPREIALASPDGCATAKLEHPFGSRPLTYIAGRTGEG